jgi:hypothetical protein
MARNHGGVHLGGKHIGKPMSAAIVALGLLILWTTYYVAEPLRTTTQGLWGVIAILLGIALWAHHAKKE